MYISLRSSTRNGHFLRGVHFAILVTNESLGPLILMLAHTEFLVAVSKGAAIDSTSTLHPTVTSQDRQRLVFC